MRLLCAALVGLVGCGGVKVETWACEDVPWDGIDVGDAFPVIMFCDQASCRPDSGTMTNGATGWESNNCDYAGPMAYLRVALVPWSPQEYRLDTESIPADDGLPLISYCVEGSDRLRCSYLLASTDAEGDAVPVDASQQDGYLLFQWKNVGATTVIGASEAREGIAVEGEVPLIRVCQDGGCWQDWNWWIEEDALFACGDPDTEGRVEVTWLK